MYGAFILLSAKKPSLCKSQFPVRKGDERRKYAQPERYSLLELLRNSTMPSFTTDAAQYQQPEDERVRVPIEDGEFNVTYQLVCKKENKKRFRLLFEELLI